MGLKLPKKEDIRNILAGTARQVNMFDNGRTYKQKTPTNDRSVFGQLTHNGTTNVAGNMLVKPLTNTVAASVVEPARSLFADVTNNPYAKAAAEQRKRAALAASAPGMAIDLAVKGTQSAYNLGFKAPLAGLTGNEEASRAARTVGLQEFNATPAGLLTRPLQYGIANSQHASDTAQGQVGLQPDATGAQKFVGDPVAGAVSVGGLKLLGKVGAKEAPAAIKQGNKAVANFAKDNTIPLNERGTLRIAAGAAGAGGKKPRVTLNTEKSLDAAAKRRVLTVAEKDRRAAFKEAKQTEPVDVQAYLKELNERGALPASTVKESLSKNGKSFPVPDEVSPADVKQIVATHRRRFGDDKVQVADIENRPGVTVSGKYKYEDDMITIASDNIDKLHTLDHEHVHKAIGQFLSDKEIEGLYKDIVTARGGKRRLQAYYRAEGYKNANWRTAAEEEIANSFTDFLRQQVVSTSSTNFATSIARWAADKGLPESVVKILYKLSDSIHNHYRPRHAEAANNLAAFFNRVEGGEFKGAPRVTRKAQLPISDRTANKVIDHLIHGNYPAGLGVKAAGKLLDLRQSKTAPKMQLQANKPDVDAYLDELNQRQKEARKSDMKSKVVRAKNSFKSKFVDSFAPIEDVVHQAEKDGAVIDPKHNITYAIDRALRANTIASEHMKREGLPDIIQAVPDTKTFDQYLIAKHGADVEVNTGRNATKDAALVKQLAPQYEAAAQALGEYNHKLLDKAVEYGLVTKESAAFLKKKYPNYVPLERIFSEDELNGMGRKGSGGGKASIGTQTVTRKMHGSKRVIESPLDSIIKKTETVFQEGERANAGRILADYKDLPGNPFQIVPLRTAKKVNIRYDSYKKLAESRPLRQQLSHEVARTKREMTALIRRNAKLAPQVLKKVVSSKQTVNNTAIKVANGTDRLPGRSKQVSKVPSTADIQEAFEQYLDGNPKLVRNMYEFIGNKQQIAKLDSRLSALKKQFTDLKRERAAQFSAARANADAAARNKTTFSTFRDGIKEVYETSPEVAAAAKSLNKEQMNVLMRIVAAPTRLLRLGATSVNVGFAGANIARDVVSSFVNSKQSIASPAVFLDALQAAVYHRGEKYQELLREGAGGTSFDIARNDPVRSVASLRAGRSAGTRIAYTVRHPSEIIRFVEDTIGRSEEFTRAFQYYGNKRAYLNKGASKGDAQLMAAHEARNNTVNFARGGDYARVMNTVLPYFNAGIQGSRTLLRNLRDRPAQTSAKIAVSTLFPMAAITAWNLSDPERKKAYDDIRDSSPTELENNLVIIPPNPKQDDSGRWNAIKIPLSQEVAGLADGVRRGIESWQGDENFDFKRLGADLFGTVTSLKTGSGRELANQFVPQAVKPAVETLANQNLYFGNQVVPDALKNLTPEDQVQQGTSGTAKVLGKLTNQSPLTVDNTIRTATGGAGQNLVRLSDIALAKTGKISDSDVKGKGFIDSVVNRFNGAQGSTEGGLYFKTLQDESKKQKLAGKDYNLLNAVKSKEIDGDGQPIPQNEKDALSNAAIRANNPRVVEVEAAAAKSIAQKTGRPLDPLYTLTPAQRETYYRIQASPYKGEDYNRLSDQAASWLPDLQKARSAFFDKLGSGDKTGVTPTARVAYPTFNDDTQSKLDAYFAIDDPTERATYIASNPDVGKAFDKINEYTNARRVAQGYDPFGAYPKASPAVEAATTAYFAMDKDQRKAYIKSNPDMYAQVQKSLADNAAWQLANNAGEAKYQGEELNQKALKSAYSLGQYSIFKNPDTGVYSIDPAAAFLANFQARYGGGSSGSRNLSGGSSRSISRTAGGKGARPKVSVRKSGKTRGRARVARRGSGSNVSGGKAKVTLKKSLV